MGNHDPLLNVKNFFDLSKVPFSDLFEGIDYVWEVLEKRDTYIRDRIISNTARMKKKGFYTEGDVYVGKKTVIEPGAYIKGPTIIGDHCEIRQGAYIRGNVIIGHNSVIGHGTEVIRSIILNSVRADHFAYIGDSVLGNHCHLGAGVILANVKMRTKTSSVRIRINGKPYDTGMRKVGGILGDNTEIGCNGLVNPGTVLGKGVTVYPGNIVHGYYPSGTAITVSSRDERAFPFVHQETQTPIIERIMCPNCGEEIASMGRVQELIAYCKEFFGQCSCGQKYHIALSLSGGAILSFPDRHIETYLQVLEKKPSALRSRPH
ncbi:MAG: hypothetical protein GTN74_09940 [Proteobacteria bacterium]|nr:hypothetical protein [Pseudomonadota bacterium]NIS70346.1 hypothetical protein [Pseudomonadota bacterium]